MKFAEILEAVKRKKRLDAEAGGGGGGGGGGAGGGRRGSSERGEGGCG